MTTKCPNCPQQFALPEQMFFHMLKIHKLCHHCNYEDISMAINSNPGHTNWEEHIKSEKHIICDKDNCDSLLKSTLHFQNFHRREIHQNDVNLSINNTTIVITLKRTADGLFLCPCTKFSHKNAKNIQSHWKFCSMNNEQSFQHTERRRARADSGEGGEELLRFRSRQRGEDEEDIGESVEEDETQVEIENETVSNEGGADRLDTSATNLRIHGNDYEFDFMHDLPILAYNMDGNFFFCDSCGEGLIGRDQKSIFNHFHRHHGLRESEKTNIFSFINERSNIGSESIRVFKRGPAPLVKPKPVPRIDIHPKAFRYFFLN